MSPRDLLNEILKLAEAAIPVIAGPDGDKYLAAGRAIVGLIESVQSMLDQGDQAKAEVTRAELDAVIARVNAHADTTIASLGGDAPEVAD